VTERVLPLSIVLQRIRDVLENDVLLSGIWIEAEISKFQVWNGSGHAYFTLKDETGVLDGVMWKQKVIRQSFTPRVGDQVLVRGSMSFYAARGTISFQADTFQPMGTGILQAQFEALRQRLESEGLFDESRKRALPPFPRRIAVVTSPSGAVWHDIQRVIARRYPLTELMLVRAVVQGDAAPPTIVDAIEAAQLVDDVDVIVVARGGGSIEDLWAFNDERVVRAIFASNVPVVSAIGHETDFTLADFVADVRAPTPSVAAEIVVPDVVDLYRQVVTLHRQAAGIALGALQGRRIHLHHLEQRLASTSPLHRIPAFRASVDHLRLRTNAAIQSRLQRTEAAFARIDAVLHALDPMATLDRGFVHLARAEGAQESITRLAALQEGDNVRATFADGYADFRTTAIMPGNEPDER
jgi:exodeoxyribonuclease VII large subunit